MPKTELIAKNALEICMWTITESAAELESLCLTPPAQNRKNFTLEDRYKQYLVTQILFQEMFPGCELNYASTGKPMVNNNFSISISHTANIVVMMRSAYNCGVDIEKIDSRVAKVKHKFLNDEELLLIENAPVETLVRYWCAKEAMFKVYGSQEVFMRNNIFVTDMTERRAKAKLTDINFEINRIINFQQLDTMMLAWTETTDEH